MTDPPRLRQPRLADMIAGRFRGQILDGSLAAGERLPRQEVLARELGVSLVVVREALRMLEAQGLVTVHRGKTGGATVRAPDGAGLVGVRAAMTRIGPEDVRATLVALDGLCAQTAAALSQPDRAALGQQLAGSLEVQADLAGNEEAFALECGRFHAEISRGCGLSLLRSICDAVDGSARQLDHAVTRPCERRGPGALRMAQILADHRRVAAAIAAGDGPAASGAAAHA